MGALRSAISAKISECKITIVENFDVAEGKTKLYRNALNKLEAGKTTLLLNPAASSTRSCT